MEYYFSQVAINFQGKQQDPLCVERGDVTASVWQVSTPTGCVVSWQGAAPAQQQPHNLWHR